MDYSDHVANIEKRIREHHTPGATTMIPEPLSDARLNELDSWGGKLVSEAQRFQGFGELVREVRRLRAIPPDVLAAMERFRGNEFGKGSWPYEGALYDVITLATWAVSHFGKDGA